MLHHAEQGDYTLVLSPIVILEARRNIRRQFPDFVSDFQQFLELIDYEEAPLPTRKEVKANPDLVRQKKDIPVALSIGAAKVDHFVTYDRDFTDEDESTEKVRQLISSIMLPPVFLRDVMGWTSDELEAIRFRNWSDME